MRAEDNAGVMKEWKSLCWDSELEAEIDAASESKERGRAKMRTLALMACLCVS